MATSNVFLGDDTTSSSSALDRGWSNATSRASLMPGAPTSSTDRDALSKVSLMPEEKPTSGKGSAAKGAVKGLIAGVNLANDLAAAQSAYSAIRAENAINLMLSNMNEYDAYYRGRQRALDRRMEGENASNEAMAHLAAQGVDLSNPGAQNVIGSYKAMGVFNAMREEANMFREAFKFDVEQAQLEYSNEIAAINRNTAKLQAYINFGVGMVDAAVTANPDKFGSFLGE